MPLAGSAVSAPRLPSRASAPERGVAGRAWWGSASVSQACSCCRLAVLSHSNTSTAFHNPAHPAHPAQAPTWARKRCWARTETRLLVWMRGGGAWEGGALAWGMLLASCFGLRRPCLSRAAFLSRLSLHSTRHALRPTLRTAGPACWSFNIRDCRQAACAPGEGALRFMQGSEGHAVSGENTCDRCSMDGVFKGLPKIVNRSPCCDKERGWVSPTSCPQLVAQKAGAPCWGASTL